MPNNNYSSRRKDNIIIYEGIKYAEGNLFQDCNIMRSRKQSNDKICFPQNKFPLWINSFLKNPLMTKDFLANDEIRSEDAFILNIYAPEEADNCPVLIFIHGGSMTSGSANLGMYNGEKLAKNGIVVVVFNYRINAPGTLWYKDKGNRAFKDQHIAIKWISENIEIFGGDPNNIVLSGQSNGALSVLVQLCIKENEELFNRAILMSPAFPEIRSVEVAKQMSDKALINSGIRSLEYASLKDILKIKDNFMNLVIDDELFKDDILNILKKGDFIKMPILVGTCSDEFSIYDNFLFRYFLGIKSDEKHSEKKYRKYFGNYYDEFMMILKEKKDDISQIQIKMLGYIFHKSALQIMEYFSIYSDVYAYYSEFAPTVFGKKNGAYHGSDISMLFDNLEVEDSIYKLESNIFRDDIISFIKYGKIDGYPVYKKDSRNIRIYSNKSKKDIEYPNFNLLWSMIQDGVFEKLFDDIFSKFRNR